MGTVAHHLFSLVGDMGTHSCQPLQRIKGLLGLPLLGPVDHLGFFRDVIHPLLGEGCPDNIPSWILHGLFVAGLNSGTAMNIEAGVPPRSDELDHFLPL